MQTTPSLGYVIGGLSVAILLICAIAWLVASIINLRNYTAEKKAGYPNVSGYGASYKVDSKITDWKFGVAIGAVASPILALILFAGILFPYDMDYHQFRVVEGKVDAVASRQIAVDKAMSQRFVVTIGGQPYAVDDTRAALVKPGDDVTLSCMKDYQWAAESGWVCNWGKQ